MRKHGAKYTTRKHQRQRVGSMNYTTTLLDKYKNACSLASDNACAESLGVGRAAVSKWRNGYGHPEVDIIERMCRAIDEPFGHWAHLIESQRARNPAAKRAWLRLAGVAATLVAVTWAPGMRAETHAPGAQKASHVYIMRNYDEVTRILQSNRLVSKIISTEDIWSWLATEVQNYSSRIAAIGSRSAAWRAG